jgi:hypothetical protein
MYKTKLLHFFIISLFCFLFKFESVGQTKPINNPLGIYFKNIKAYTFDVQFDRVLGAENYIVLCSRFSYPLGKPQDNNTYLKGDYIENAKVAYIGRDTFFTPKGVRANSHYFFVVYAFNGNSGNEKYQLIDAPSNNLITPGLQFNSYYSELSVNAPNLTAQLHDLITTHIKIPYSNYKTTLLEDIELIDTVQGKRYIECVYTGEKKVFSGTFDWTQQGYSREHTFPHSWMSSYPANNPEKPEYSDLFNLYPTNLDKANSVRNNYPFGEINGKVHYEYLYGRLGEMNGELVYEPSDKHKGNVARSIFYMLTAYNSSEMSWFLPYKQNEEILKKWHFLDVPDNYEITRQEYIYNLQGNRNPFIDSINLVCKIDFYKMIYSKEKCLSNQEEFDFKNGFKCVFEFENQRFQFKSNDDLFFEVLNLNGSLIQNLKTNVWYDNLKSGIYLIRIKKLNYTSKIVF